MGARCVEDLDAWRLAVEVRDLVIALSRRKPMCFDRSFCDDIRRSARSAPANIAEGFRRFSHRDFARHVGIALGSLEETRTHLSEATKSEYVDHESAERLAGMIKRAIGASVRLRNYLTDTATPDFLSP